MKSGAGDQFEVTAYPVLRPQLTGPKPIVSMSPESAVLTEPELGDSLAL